MTRKLGAHDRGYPKDARVTGLTDWTEFPASFWYSLSGIMKTLYSDNFREMEFEVTMNGTGFATWICISKNAIQTKATAPFMNSVCLPVFGWLNTFWRVYLVCSPLRPLLARNSWSVHGVQRDLEVYVEMYYFWSIQQSWLDFIPNFSLVSLNTELCERQHLLEKVVIV